MAQIYATSCVLGLALLDVTHGNRRSGPLCIDDKGPQRLFMEDHQPVVVECRSGSPGSRFCGICPYHSTGSGYFSSPCCSFGQRPRRPGTDRSFDLSMRRIGVVRWDGSGRERRISQDVAHGPLPFPGGGKIPGVSRASARQPPPFRRTLCGPPPPTRPSSAPVPSGAGTWAAPCPRRPERLRAHPPESAPVPASRDHRRRPRGGTPPAPRSPRAAVGIPSRSA